MMKKRNRRNKVFDNISISNDFELENFNTPNEAEHSDVINNKKLITKFVTIVSIVVGTFVIISGIVVFGFGGMRFKIDNVPIVIDKGNGATEQNKKDMFSPTLKLVAPTIKSTFLINGLDEEAGLSDTNIVVSFDTEKKQVDVISIPRDTKITFDAKTREEFKNDTGKSIPEYLKLTEVSSWAGKEFSAKYIQKEIEDILSIKIDYYFQIEFSAFMELVDIVGGVEMEIRPQGMYYYDPTANFLINLKGGLQYLDGDKARQAVRFRSYPMGDIERIAFQQKFLKALLEQSLNREIVMKNIPELIDLFLKSVNTNFPISSSGKYISHIQNVRDYEINMHTMPFEIWKDEWKDKNGVSHAKEFVVYEKGIIDEFINDILYNTSKNKPDLDIHVNDEIDIVFESSKDLNIQILNGGNKSGYATKIKDFLSEEGYNHLVVDNYNGTHKQKTRIFTKGGTVGNDLIGYFTDAYIEVDTELGNTYDIVIIVGTDEKNDF
jgi:polyisoprenyl-teichoic acid--peptidoglycan teichoic acid transferase